MYRLSKDEDYILLIVYVDDLLYIGSTDTVATWFEGELEKDLSLMVSSTVTQYLGLNIEEGENAIYLNAAKYADTIAKRFALTPTTISTPYRYTAGNDKRSSTLLKSAGIRSYQRKLGCLLFAAVTCRPDLSYSASQLATYLKRPEIEHLAELDLSNLYAIVCGSSNVGRLTRRILTTPELSSSPFVGSVPTSTLSGLGSAPGAGESAPSGTASAQAFHTFTLDSGASRSFFRDRTTLTPLSQPVAISLADPSGGPVLASFSTVLPCPAAPSGSLSGLYLPSFSTNLVSGADLQDQGVDQFTPASQRVTHCTCARTGPHLATFTRRPGSSLYTLSTESPPVSASGQVATSSQVLAATSGSGPESAPCSCRLLSHQTLFWHHRLGHPSLPRLRGMASRVLVSGLPRSLPPLPPGPAPTCVPCVEGQQRAAPHSSEFPPTEAPLQTLHMDV
ncbi:unnamed protein product [Closterium sp. NIES-54]